MAVESASNAFGRWLSLLLLFFVSFPCIDAHGDAGRAHEALHVSRQAQTQSAKDRWSQLHSTYLANLKNSLEPNGQCTWDNMVVRREWGDMTVEARKEFLSALHCLRDKPSMTDRGQFPGVRDRWDDFAVGHLLNVMSVHRSPWLAVWHRHYTWRLERALREECGYQYGLPYWHWSRYLDQDINTWPLFDNSETSISGNGTQTGPQCACVETGPLANWTINLGPQGEGTWGCKRNPRPDGRGYNPSCIERTFNLQDLKNVRYEDVVYTIDNSTDANRFASLIELEAPSIHNMPHVFMGGTQIDITFSSQDPWFFFHHCMVEFVFGLWQSLDFPTRTTTLPDAQIFEASRSQGWPLPPPSVNLDSEIFISPVFGNITVREAMWTTRNHYCYRYE